MTGRERLSASVDAELLHLARSAVEAGRAESVSAWVNHAMRLQADHERRMEALDSFLASYEAERGVITEAEMDDAVRRARGRATVIRSKPNKGQASRRGVA